MEYYSALETGWNLTHTTTWMTFEDMMLSEIRQSRKSTCCMISLIQGTWRSQIQRESGMVVAAGRGEWELVSSWCRVSVWEDEKVLAMDGGDGYTRV